MTGHREGTLADHRLDEYESQCSHCGVRMARADCQLDGESLCGVCFTAAMEPWLYELNRVEAEAPRHADGSINFKEADRA